MFFLTGWGRSISDLIYLSHTKQSNTIHNHIKAAESIGITTF